MFEHLKSINRQILLASSFLSGRARLIAEHPRIFYASCLGILILGLYVPYGADVNRVDNDGDTPLHYAAGNGRADTVAFLIQHGADVNRVNNYGDTALHYAASNGHTDTVALLIQHGADVNRVNNDGDTPLHMAVRNGHTDTVQLLIQHGADVNRVNNYGDTALHYAACNWQHTDAVALLIQQGADVNRVNNDGDTALHIAAGNRHHTDTVALLIKQGADVNRVNNDGDTALHYAAAYGRKANVTLILTHKLLQNDELNDYEKQQVQGLTKINFENAYNSMVIVANTDLASKWMRFIATYMMVGLGCDMSIMEALVYTGLKTPTPQYHYSIRIATAAMPEVRREAYITAEVAKLVDMCQQKYQISIA